MLRKPALLATLTHDGPLALLGPACLLVLLAAWLFAPGSTRFVLRERALDLLLPLVSRTAPVEPAVVIVDIDRAALARFGPWPWPRGRIAEIVAAAAAGKPAVAAPDILFARPDRFSDEGDSALAAALARVPSVLGFALDTVDGGEDLPETPVLSRAPV